MNVGFLGLGTMGKAMAANLIKAGHTLTVWNRSPGPASELAALGATVASGPRDAFRGDAVISMLADDASTNAVVTDDLLGGAPKGLTHINMATISVAAAKTLTERHTRHGLTYVAAPVFGRAEVALAGKLNIVAGGPDAAIAHVQPLFDAMGQKTWRAGTDPAQATLIKITGNFMLAASIEMLSEAFALAEKGGVDPKLFTEIMTGTLFAAPLQDLFRGHQCPPLRACRLQDDARPEGCRPRPGSRPRLADPLADGEPGARSHARRPGGGPRRKGLVCAVDHRAPQRGVGWMRLAAA